MLNPIFPGFLSILDSIIGVIFIPVFIILVWFSHQTTKRIAYWHLSYIESFKDTFKTFKSYIGIIYVRNKWVILVGLIVLVLLGGIRHFRGFFLPQPKSDFIEMTDKKVPKMVLGTVHAERHFGEYTIKTYELREESFLTEGSFEIIKNGIQVYAGSGYRFEIEEPGDSAWVIGDDITGDGQPNLIVSEWTGGAHCCSLVHIFEIGSNFRHIQTIDAKHGPSPRFFKNLDDRPDLEFLMFDWTFAYWKACFARSPAPTIILKYNGKQYEIACDLMRELSLSPRDLNQLSTEIKLLWLGWTEYHPPSILWTEMLNLIYTGNMFQAWDLIDLSWPEGIGGKEQFIEEFKLQLQESPFWEPVQKMNLKIKKENSYENTKHSEFLINFDIKGNQLQDREIEIIGAMIVHPLSEKENARNRKYLKDLLSLENQKCNYLQDIAAYIADVGKRKKNQSLLTDADLLKKLSNKRYDLGKSYALNLMEYYNTGNVALLQAHKEMIADLITLRAEITEIVDCINIFFKNNGMPNKSISREQKKAHQIHRA